MKCGLCAAIFAVTMGRCWWCGRALCSLCGDGPGHCGHPEAKRIIGESADAEAEVRRQIARAMRGRELPN